MIEVATAVLCAWGGFLAMLWLMLMAFEGAVETSRGEDRDTPSDWPDELFVAMPGHLQTKDEMVHWMTTELPKLIARARV